MCLTNGRGQSSISQVGVGTPEVLVMVVVSGLFNSGWVAVHEKVSPWFHGSAQPGRMLETL